MKNNIVKTSIEILFQINFIYISPLPNSGKFRYFIIETPINEYELTLYKSNPEMFIKSIQRLNIDNIAGYFSVKKSDILNLNIVGYNIKYYTESDNYHKTIKIKEYSSDAFN